MAACRNNACDQKNCQTDAMLTFSDPGMLHLYNITPGQTRCSGAAGAFAPNFSNPRNAQFD